MKENIKADICYCVALAGIIAVVLFADYADAAKVQRIQLSGYDVPAYTQSGLVNICVVQFDRNSGQETALTAYEASCVDVLKYERDHWLELYSKMYGAVSVSVSINGVSLSSI